MNKEYYNISFEAADILLDEAEKQIDFSKFLLLHYLKDREQDEHTIGLLCEVYSLSNKISAEILRLLELYKDNEEKQIVVDSYLMMFLETASITKLAATKELHFFSNISFMEH